jgi:hypothetical protein
VGRRWTRYWFADGGRHAVAIVRIAIAAAVLLTLDKLSQPVSTGDLPGTHTLYRPVGIWMVLGHNAPPDFLVDLIWVVAWGATAMMLVGLFSRAAAATSFVSAVALAALSFSAQKTWSHQYNVVFLAQLAFLGARGGDALSVDSLIRRVRDLPAIDLPRAYQWSLRLVQLAVALMFAGAAFHKLLHGHFTLRWALSDNLRNQLLVRFDLAGLERPALVDWLIDDPWKYKTAAVLNLISQAAPLAACFLVRRPVWRAAFGVFFLVETVALAHVVGLWNPHWLPLYAVFVDWDWLLRRRDVPPVPEGWQPPRARSIFIACFLGYEVLTSFVPTVDQKLNTFPFSSFPMFATVRATPPYGEHRPYALEGDHFEIISDEPIYPGIQLWFDHQNRGMFNERDPVVLEKRLRATIAQAQRRFPEWKIKGARLWLALFIAPPYPAPAHFEMRPVAIVGAIEGDGTFHTAIGKLDGDVPVPAAVGVDLTDKRELFINDDPTPVYAPGDGDPVIAAAVAFDGKRWLVATRSSFHWN